MPTAFSRNLIQLALLVQLLESGTLLQTLRQAIEQNHHQQLCNRKLGFYPRKPCLLELSWGKMTLIQGRGWTLDSSNNIKNLSISNRNLYHLQLLAQHISLLFVLWHHNHPHHRFLLTWTSLECQCHHQPVPPLQLQHYQNNN